ncbi:MAG TPA: hypothetical protein VF614_15350 [Chthoniobacteraceae bacterium]
MNLLRQLLPLAALAGWLASTALAQTPGSLDPTFDTGAGVNPDYYSDVAIGADGKAVVVGGYATSGKILRINPDGSLDRGFAVSAGFGQQVDEAPASVVIQTDLKIVVGGFFGFFEGTSRQGILRLNADGTIDTAYNPGAQLQRVNDASVFIRQIALQPDGKIIAAGSFRYVGADGVSRYNLVRFNANGTLDATFKPQAAVGFRVEALGVAAAGQIVLSYTEYSPEFIPTFGVIRLLSSGALDTSFDDGAGATQFYVQSGESAGADHPMAPTALAVQPDGSVIVGGIFDKFNGVARAGLARLMPTGAVDPNFVPAGFRYVFNLQDEQRNHSAVLSTLRIVDGKVLVSGDFTHVGSPEGPARRGLARLNGNGTLDESFDSAGGFGPSFPQVLGVSVRAGTGEIVAAGGFSLVGSVKVPGVVQLTSSGSVDAAFVAQMQQGFAKPVLVLAMQEDGKVLVGESYTRTDEVVRPGLSRLNPDGSVDETFNTGTLFLRTLPDGSQVNAPATHIVIQGDGKIVVAGSFVPVQGSYEYKIMRLNADGSFDPSFDPGSFIYETVPGNVLGLALWRDPANPSAPERIVAIGGFTDHVEVETDANGNPSSTLRSRAGIARLNADGSLDLTFDPGTGFTNRELRNAVMSALLVQPDGKIIAAGSFSAYNDVPSRTIARLNADGTRDTTFDTSVSFANQGFINAMARSDDGKLLIGGYLAPSDPNSFFTTIIRLNENGSSDATFDAGIGFGNVGTGGLQDLLLQADGKIFAAGDFLSYRGVNRRSIARLNPNGTLDTSFNPGTGFGGAGVVFDIALQADGKIVAVGSFTKYYGTVRHFLARIQGGAGGGGGDPDPDPESDLRLTATGAGAADPTGKTTRPGDLLTYTLSYANLSDAPVTDAVVTATVPSGTSFQPAKPADGSRLVIRQVNGVSVKQVEWKIGSLAAGAGGTVSFQVLVSKNAQIETEIEFSDSGISAKRNGAALPRDRANRVNSLVTSLLNVTSTTVTSTAGPGGLITYKFAVRNDSSTAMTDVQLRYEVQTGSAVVSAFFTDANGTEIGSPGKAPGKAFNPSVDDRGETVTWFFNKLPARSTGYAKLTVRLWYDRAADEPLQGGELVGSFRLSGKAGTVPRIIPTTVAATGQASTERPYLGLSKTVDEVSLVTDPTVGEVAATSVGERFTFSLWAYNIGERPAERVFIQERAPENTVIDPASVRINDAAPSEKVSVTDKGRTLVLPIGQLNPGVTVKVSYRVRVQPREDRAINHFLVSEGGYVGTASLGETVDAYPDPLLVKVVAPASFAASTEEAPARAEIGQVVQHFIRFHNNGGKPAKNARITNAIPAGAKFRGAAYVEKIDGSYVDRGSARNGLPITKPALDATSGTILFPLGSLAAGEAVTVRVDLVKTAQVLALDPPELVNIARIDFGPARTAQREAAADFEPDPFTLPPYAMAIGRTPTLDTSVPRFFLGMMAPATVRAGEQFTYLGFYGNTGDTAGVATIRLNIPPSVAALEIVNLTTDRPDPDAFAQTDAEGNVVIAANIPPHTQLPFQIVCRAIGEGGKVVLASEHRISGDSFSGVRAGKPLATYIYDGAAVDEAAMRSSVESALLDAAGVNFAYGRDNAPFKAELRQLGAGSISTILVGADFIALRNGAFLVPLGGGRVLAGAVGILSNDGASVLSNDGASIISGGAGNIISGGAGNIISGGAGNIQFHGLPGFTGSPSAGILLTDPNRIISGGAGNLLNLGGHNLFGGITGTALVNNAGGGFANADYFRATLANIISGGAGNLLGQDGAGIISGGAGNIVAGGAGNIISGGGGNIIGDNGSGFISNDGGSLTTFGGGNIISGGGGNIISGGAGN